jgi:hypothetical protein
MIFDKPTMGPVAIARLRPEGGFIEFLLAISTAAPFLSGHGAVIPLELSLRTKAHLKGA